MKVTIRDIIVIHTAPEGINLTVVKVETSEPGLYGLGCATFAYRHLAVETVIREYLKPLMVGREVANVTENWTLMHHNAYWRHGPIENNAISGIDMALWDIKGQMANMPVYELFGGKYRQGVPIYRHADGKDVVEICDNIQKYLDDGITHIRCQSGGYGGTYGPAPLTAPEGALAGVYLDPKAYIDNTVRLFAEIRKKVGYQVQLCHDVHERLYPSDSIQLATRLEPFQLFFLEDAISLEQLDWMRNLRRATTIPLAVGELFTNPAEWKILVQERLIDYIRVHITQIGGITAARRLQVFTEQFGVRIAWHGPGDMSPLAHAANIHLDIAAPNLGIQEWSGTQPPNFVIQDLKGPKDALLEVFPHMPEYHKGYVYPNARPGFGVDINEKEAAKYPNENTITQWTQTRLVDGSLITP